MVYAPSSSEPLAAGAGNPGCSEPGAQQLPVREGDTFGGCVGRIGSSWPFPSGIPGASGQRAPHFRLRHFGL
jgi:hypothetical protein